MATEPVDEMREALDVSTAIMKDLAESMSWPSLSDQIRRNLALLTRTQEVHGDGRFNDLAESWWRRSDHEPNSDYDEGVCDTLQDCATDLRALLDLPAAPVHPEGVEHGE